MLKRRSLRRGRMLFIFVLLLSGLGAIGAAYASWSEDLTLTANVTSGSLDTVFAQNAPYRCFVSDAQGNALYGAEAAGAAAVVAADGKTAEITVDGAVLYQTLTAGSYLRLECPVGLGENGTIDTLEVYRADLTQAAREQVQLMPTEVTLRIADQVQIIDESRLDAYGQAISFDVYRQIEVQDQRPIGVIYLALTEESRALLDTAPTQFTLAETDLSQALAEQLRAEGTQSVSGEVRVVYTMTLPLYLQQGSHDMWRASGKEGNQ